MYAKEFFYNPVDIKQQISTKAISLDNSSSNKKTLILDLDETLIHCNESIDIKGDTFVTITDKNSFQIQASINIRPYAAEFIKEMSKLYEIIIFTASQKIYADPVINQLDPHKQYVSHRLYRESCIFSND